MQLYALDHQNAIISAWHATKKFNYRCMECKATVRLREGEERHPHFFHLSRSPNCRLAGKSLVHLQLQLDIKNSLPNSEASLEYRFPQIQRIADVAWHSKKIVFEIQCSPILKSEALERIADYQQAGYQVVWILHERSFNHLKLTAAEQALAFFPRYYTNRNEKGEGQIYDQWHYAEQGRKKHSLPRLKIDLTRPYFKERLGFQGDIHSLENNHPYRIKIEEIKNEESSKVKQQRFHHFFLQLKTIVLNAYHQLLKRYC